MPGFELNGRAHLPLWPAHRDVGIGVVGAGFIVRDCHLVAYAEAGFPVVGITSRTHDRAREVADARGIPRVFPSLEAMLEEPAGAEPDISGRDNLGTIALCEAVLSAGTEHRMVRFDEYST